MWRHGKVNLNGSLLETSWKVAGGAVVAIDIPRGQTAGTGDDFIIDGVHYVRENLGGEDFGDRMTVPLITRTEMERRLTEIEDAKAKAKAEFEGKPWPPVKADAKPATKAKPSGE